MSDPVYRVVVSSLDVYDRRGETTEYVEDDGSVNVSEVSEIAQWRVAHRGRFVVAVLSVTRGEFVSDERLDLNECDTLAEVQVAVDQCNVLRERVLRSEGERDAALAIAEQNGRKLEELSATLAAVRLRHEQLRSYAARSGLDV